jgi:hypothetical protein
MRWGLVPFWVKDIKAGFANINAKTDGVWGFLRNPSCTKQLADSLYKTPPEPLLMSRVLARHPTLSRAQ